MASTTNSKRKITPEEYRIPDNTLFQRAIEKALRQGLVPGQSKRAREWFRSYAGNLVDPRRNRLIERGHGVAAARPGYMYMFWYDPKWKDTLPFYDRFPVIYVIDHRDDGFLGINLHYLPYMARAKLMDALMSLKSDSRFDETTKLRISYNILKAASKFSLFRPCVKRYLNTHIKSSLIEVPSSDWEIAAFLPVAKWEKAKRGAVYQSSIATINRSR